MATYRTILYEAREGVATLTLNRPEQRNGMTNVMIRETREALTAAASDSKLRVLVLTGAGKSFCPGADLNHYTSDEGDIALAPEDYFVAVLLHEMPAVTIAAVNGSCAGAGLGWACGCDVRVATRSAMFNTAFLNVAFAGDMGLPWSLSRIIGAARARDLSFFPEKFTAARAEEIGLVAHVWEDDCFRERVASMVASLAARSPVALRTLKAHYLAAERMTMKDFVAIETEHHQRIGRMEDVQEAFRAFLEKRAPRFTGR